MAEEPLTEASAKVNLGTVIGVRGPVVDVRLDEGTTVPPLYGV